MQSQASFSVIVPTFNRPEALGECLQSFTALDYPADRFEVIVVDDGGVRSVDRAIEPYLPKLNLTLIRQPNAGPGVARNTGAAAAKLDFLAFTDDDCRPRGDWLSKLAQVVSEHPQAMVGGLCINAFPKNLCCAASQMILDVVNSHFNRDHNNSIFFPSDNLCVSRRMFEEIGGFDPAFRWSEDRDLCDRWAARGWKLLFRPEAVVMHARVMGLKGFCKQHFNYGRGAWRFHRARERRGTGSFEVDGNFYLKCFREPWRTQPIHRAIPLTVLLGIWQFANTAGFFYEKLRRRSPAAARGSAVETPAGPTSRQEA